MLISLFQIELITALGTKTSSARTVLPQHQVLQLNTNSCFYQHYKPPTTTHALFPLFLLPTFYFFKDQFKSNLFKQAFPGQLSMWLRALALNLKENRGLNVNSTTDLYKQLI